jgi:hypothetical protein
MAQIAILGRAIVRDQLDAGQNVVNEIGEAHVAVENGSPRLAARPQSRQSWRYKKHVGKDPTKDGDENRLGVLDPRSQLVGSMVRRRCPLHTKRHIDGAGCQFSQLHRRVSQRSVPAVERRSVPHSGTALEAQDRPKRDHERRWDLAALAQRLAPAHGGAGPLSKDSGRVCFVVRWRSTTWSTHAAGPIFLIS